MHVIIKGLTALMVGAVMATSAWAETKVRAAVLKIGTVNWELTTIKANGFDTENGFDLVIEPYADNGATRVAFEGGEADLVVADWIWAARQRAEGKDYIFVPYSTAVGGIVVGQDSPTQTLEDLKGQKIGIAGGPVDKSWLILRAYAQQAYGMDLAAETEQVFGAPPLIMKSAMKGEVGAAINFWHFLAKMKAGGMRELVSVSDAATALGLDPDVPLLGYVIKENFVAEHPEIVKHLYAASRAAKDVLQNDDTAWDALRDQMNAANDAQYAALVRDWRAGIPPRGNVDTEAAGQLLSLMADLGGAKLVGKANTIPDGLFVDLE